MTKLFFSGLILFFSFQTVSYASFYLMSNDKQHRCDTLGQWVAHIEEELFSGRFPTSIDEDFVEKASPAYGGKAFKRSFGRDFDRLSARHRKQIHADISRCKLATKSVAQQLQIPFARKSELKKPPAVRWLRAIYASRDKPWIDSILTRYAAIPADRAYQCQARTLSRKVN